MTDYNDSSGINFLGMLALLFIGLKLTGHVSWSWWLILSPLYVKVFLIALYVAVKTKLRD